MQTVKEITPFEVPAGKDEDFLQGWHEIAERLRPLPGVISLQLHESLDPAAKFRFVAVTEWGSSLLYEAVRDLTSRAFEELRRQMPFAGYPASYRLVASEAVAPPSVRLGWGGCCI